MDFNNQAPMDALCEKWEPLLEHDALPRIEDSYKKKVTSVLLENQEKALREQYIQESGPANAMGGNFSDPQITAGGVGALAGYDPVLISLVRRAMPNLMAYDIAGVQPMSAPTGLIFAMRARYGAQAAAGAGSVASSPEALFQEANAQFSGNSGPVSQVNGVAAFSATGGVNPTGRTGGYAGAVGATYNVTDPRDNSALTPFGEAFRGMLTGTAEGLGSDAGTSETGFAQMAFNIDRVAVSARSRALKAEYTTELAQDLKAVHGLDAETELANILSTEILAEINRELVRTIYYNAQLGATQKDLNTAGKAGSVGGLYDLNLDSDGRWSAERFRGLMFQIEREANTIAKETRRGKGNFLICSSDVASALAMGGFLNISPAINNQLEVDDTGNTFAGVLNGKMRVYIDPYSSTTGTDFACVGYKGTSPYDAGLFYCPYVPLQMVRAVGQDTFQPRIGFKTRYGMVNNPFARNDGSGNVFNATAGGNQYYRLFAIKNLHGNQPV